MSPSVDSNRNSMPRGPYAETFARSVKVVSKRDAPVFVQVGLLPAMGLAALLLGWCEETAEPKSS